MRTSKKAVNKVSNIKPKSQYIHIKEYRYFLNSVLPPHYQIAQIGNVGENENQTGKPTDHRSLANDHRKHH